MQDGFSHLPSVFQEIISTQHALDAVSGLPVVDFSSAHDLLRRKRQLARDVKHVWFGSPGKGGGGGRPITVVGARG